MGNFCSHNVFQVHVFPLQNASFTSVLVIAPPTMPACAVILTRMKTAAVDVDVLWNAQVLHASDVALWVRRFILKEKKKSRCRKREQAAVSASSSQIETIPSSVGPGAHIRCGGSILASLFSRMQNESVVTLHNVYCLPPIFPEMWRRLEAFEAWMPTGRWTGSIWEWSACAPNCATAEPGRSKADV